jgi:hypothetical protein
MTRLMEIMERAGIPFAGVNYILAPVLMGMSLGFGYFARGGAGLRCRRMERGPAGLEGGIRGSKKVLPSCQAIREPKLPFTARGQEPGWMITNDTSTIFLNTEKPHAADRRGGPFCRLITITGIGPV